MRIAVIAAAFAMFVLLFGCVGGGPIPSGVDAHGAQYRGTDGAKATIVEFSDFQCPYCAQAEPTVERLLREYAGKVKLVYRHYPLPAHENAYIAAEASECAADGGKFWEMHDIMYANQESLDEAGLKKLAAQVGLDGNAFAACMQSGKKAEKINKDMEDGRIFGVRATPTFYIGSQMFEGAPYDKMKAAIEAELNGAN
ncbi:Thioredoxin [Candidatus Anstonella stagnisolia]|nr:Thioredoxin [Candidatus Anstonella stagnisolia]